MTSRDALRTLADAADAAAEAIVEINQRDRNGTEMSWNAKGLADYARNLRIEADELDETQDDEEPCIHCGSVGGHDQTCRDGADL